jgi:hypothetical protein
MPRRPRAISRLLPGLALAAMACQAGARAQPPATPPPRPEPAATTILPGPARASARLDAPTRNRECEACHVEIAAEWRGSLHQRPTSTPSSRAPSSASPSRFVAAATRPRPTRERRRRADSRRSASPASPATRPRGSPRTRSWLSPGTATLRRTRSVSPGTATLRRTRSWLSPSHARQRWSPALRRRTGVRRVPRVRASPAAPRRCR